MCGSGDGGLEASVTERRNDEAFKGPILSEMKVDKAPTLTKTKLKGYLRMQLRYRYA